MRKVFLLAFVGLSCGIVDPPEPPPVGGMTLDPGVVAYSYDANPAAQETFTLTISNVGDLSFDWTDATTSAWLSLATSTATLLEGEFSEVDVTVDVPSLPDGLSVSDVVIEWTEGVDRAVRVAVYIDGGQMWIIVDGENGDDDLGDGTVGSPYKTITKGLTEAASADTVLCLPATYEEPVTLVEGIALVGSGPQGCLIDAGTGPSIVADDTITAATGLSGFRVTGDDPVDGEGSAVTCTGSPVVTDCEFVFCRGPGSAAVLFKGSSAASFSDCVVGLNSAAYGVACLETSSPIISHCELSNNGYSAVICGGSATATVEFCELTSNGISGVVAIESAQPVIDANTFSDNAQGITLSGDSFSVVTNNVIVDCVGYPGLASESTAKAVLTNNTIAFNDEGIWWGSASNWSIENNIIYHNAVSQWSKDVTSLDPSPYGYNCIEDYTAGGEDNFWFPPSFVDQGARDLRLAGGQCVNSGNNSAGFVPDHDRDGNARPLGGVIDRGAYEYVE